MVRILVALALTAAAGAGRVEVVETAPLGSEMDGREVRNAIEVFPELFARAESTLEVAEMYMLYYPPESKGRLLYVLYDAIVAAAQRGVRVRVLLDSTTLEQSRTETYCRMRERFTDVPGVEVRACDLRQFSRYANCMMHAKYFVVDSRVAAIGSHNWSYGGFADNRELSLVIDDTALACDVRAVFEKDWGVSGASGRSQNSDCRLQSAESTVPESRIPDRESPRLAVAGPARLADSGEYRLTDALREFVARADSSLDIEVNSITTRSDFGEGQRFGLVESLLADAGRRGVKVRLLVDHWAEEQAGDLLRRLNAQESIAVRVMDISRAGPNPGAGTVHAKFMTADRSRVMLGTATFSHRQLTECRNLAVVLDDDGTARMLYDLFERDWHSTYARSPQGP